VNIQLGYQDEASAVVTKGLSGNETVVVAGQSRLSPGTRVEPRNVLNSDEKSPSQAASAGASPT
jgi:hypothetical protein